MSRPLYNLKTLYPSPDYMGRAQGFAGQGQSAAASMMPKIPEPGKSVGGAMSGGMGGAAMGAGVHSMATAGVEGGAGAAGVLGLSGAATMGIGAGLGVLAYLLS